MNGSVMRFTPEQRKDFDEKCNVLIEWLNENCHPHCMIVIEPASAQLLEGQLAHVNEAYIKD